MHELELGLRMHSAGVRSDGKGACDLGFHLKETRNWRISERRGDLPVLRINRTSRAVSKHIFHLKLVPCAVTV